MSYRSILVYLDDTERTPVRVALAAALARKHDSHLIGLAPTGIIDIPGKPRPALAGDEYIPLTSESLYARARAVAEAFEAQVSKLGPLSFESRVDEAEPGPSTIVHGRTADLVVIAQSDHHAPTPAISWDFPPLVLMGTGRPVLVVPNAGHFASVGEHVLVAWDGSREATRAMTDSLPLLQLAGRVDLLQFEEPDYGKSLASKGIAEAVRWLQRHGIRATALEVSRQGHVGKALIAQASSLGADLIVMGAYGHSRLSELALGGATRAMLEGMSVPVLMSH
jgi:nucleotide-binding universal stress UspA family protein